MSTNRSQAGFALLAAIIATLTMFGGTATLFSVSVTVASTVPGQLAWG